MGKPNKIGVEMGNMRNTEFDIQELLQRDVYVNEKKVGTIVGERHHPNEARVQSMRIQVAPEVADEYMRKPAELAPLPKETGPQHSWRWYSKALKVNARVTTPMEKYGSN